MRSFLLISRIQALNCSNSYQWYFYKFVMQSKFISKKLRINTLDSINLMRIINIFHKIIM